MQRLQRIDEDAGDVAAAIEDLERALGQVRERQRVAGRNRIADARLNVAPPAVIGAAEAHDPAPPRMIAGQPHRLHHRLGPRHVEGDLLHAGDVLQPLDIAEDEGMVDAEHRTERAHRVGALVDAGLVEVVAEQVDAVGAGEVERAIAVDVGEHDPVRRLVEKGGAERGAHPARELEGDAVGVDELEIAEPLPRRLGEGVRARIFGGEGLGEPGEAGLAPRRDVLGRIVGAEEGAIVKVVIGDARGDPLSPSDMTGERAVLGPAEFDPRLAFHRQGGGGQRAGRESDLCDHETVHAAGA